MADSNNPAAAERGAWRYKTMMPWMERVLWGSLLMGLLFAIPLFLQAADALPGSRTMIAGGPNSDERPPIAGNISPAVGVQSSSSAASAMGGGSVR